MKTLSACVAFLLLATAGAASAQPRGTTTLRTVDELVLDDGSRMFGAVESETDVALFFRTTAGALVEAPRPRIVSLRRVAGRMVNGEFRREDPNNTRLLFGPTGRALPKGEVYLGVYEVVMPFVQVGITDRISIGGGTPLIFDVDDWDRFYWVTPKVQVYSGGGLHVAAGLFHGFDSESTGGIAYGVVTKEGAAGAFTVGGGLGYNSDGGRGGVLMVGGDAPLRRSMKFVTENYFFDSNVVTSAGIRFFGDHLSADVAVGMVFSDGSATAFPLVNFVYRF